MKRRIIKKTWIRIRTISLLAKASPHHGLDAACFENLHGLVAQLFAGKHFASFLKRRPIQIKIDCMGLCCIIVDL